MADIKCVICNYWDRLPYGKRHTTPVQVLEAEGALVAGYWIRARHPPDLAPRLCERHANTLMLLDSQEAQREERLAQVKVAEEQISRGQQLRQRASHMMSRLVPVQPQQLPGAQLPNPDKLTADPPKDPQDVIEQQPPLPPPVIFTEHIVVPEVPPELREAGTAAPAGDEAQPAAPVGAKVQYQCPSCGNTATTGEVHSCSA